MPCTRPGGGAPPLLCPWSSSYTRKWWIWNMFGILFWIWLSRNFCDIVEISAPIYGPGWSGPGPDLGNFCTIVTKWPKIRCNIVLESYIHEIWPNIDFDYIIWFRCGWRSFWVYWRARAPRRSEKRNRWKLGQNRENLAHILKTVPNVCFMFANSKSDFIVSFSIKFCI